MPIVDSKENNEVQDGSKKVGGNGKTILKYILEAVRRNWPALAALALILVLYWETMGWWYAEWMKDDSYYSHGPLVVPIALFMVWSIRSRLIKEKVQPSLWGLALILPMMPIYAIGRVFGAGSLVSLSFMLTVIGCILLIYGPRITRLLLFPSLFLVSMIPLPSIILDDITGPVQLASTTGAYLVLMVLYPDTIREGMNILMPAWSFEVGIPCSGFKLLISLLTFTAFFAYMLEGQLWRKAALFLFAAPFAIAINILRVVMIGLAGEWFGEEAGYAFHDYSGYIVLIVGFLILFKVASWFGCKEFGEAAFAPMPEKPFTGPVRHKPMWRNSLFIAGLFAAVLISNQFIPKLEDISTASIDRSEYASEIGRWFQYGPDHEIDELTLEVLKTADIHSRTYRDSEGYIIAYMNVAGTDNDAFHSPTSCLPGGGWSIASMNPIRIPVENSKEGVINATQIIMNLPRDLTERLMVVYWYQTGADTVPTTGRSRLQNMANRLIKGMKEREQVVETTYFYRLMTPMPDGEESAQERLIDFVREFTYARQQYID